MSRTVPSLKRFLDEAFRAVRHEILEAVPEAASLSLYDDFRDLSDAYTSKRLQNAVVRDVLLFATQLGHFINYAHHDPAIYQDTQRGAVHLIGLDVGGFAATVAASARNVSHALQLGLAVIAVVARLGVALENRSRLVDALAGDWSTDIVGIDQRTVEGHLEAFNQDHLKFQQAYVAATTSNSVTVSAPPTTANVFRAYCEEHGLKWQSPNSDSSSGRHGKHLPDLDLTEVVGTDPSLDTPVAAHSLFISPSRPEGGERTLDEVLTNIVLSISQQAFHPEQILTQSAASTPASTGALGLTSLGRTSRIHYLEHIMKARGIEPQMRLRELPRGKSATKGIAVIGMSGRFPGGANDIASFWDLLLSGRTTHEEIRPSRSDVQDAEEKAYAGCFLNSPGDFDHSFFHLSPKEALEADPIQRLLLMTTYEALQQAGYTPEGIKSIDPARVATFFGQTTTDWYAARPR